MTLVIGESSNLSQHLKSVIKDSLLVSVRNFLEDPSILDNYRDITLNVIFNNFQSATALGNLENPDQYIAQSIYATSLVLEKIKSFSINKIIYTSSSSVYGNNKLCAESDSLMPLNLHASLKTANEYLIAKFCQDHGFDYTIVRLFNMYGGHDEFSVISKIIKAFKEKGEITVINNGESIRDYIYINDVVALYKKILEINDFPIINIGSGRKNSLKEILSLLNKKGYSLKVNNLEREEIKVSIADTRLLHETFGEIDFQKVEEYILEEIQA